MAGPASQQNNAGQSLDTLYGTDGVGRVKLGLGDYALSGVTPVGAAHLVGTHLPGTLYDPADPVVLIAAWSNEDSDEVGPLRLNANNELRVTAPRVPTVFKSLSAVDISSEVTIWTPAGGKKFRLMGFVITQGTVTGDITLRDDTAGTTILIIPATPVGQPLPFNLGSEGILSALADNVLTAEGVSTETISGFIVGTEE